MSYESWRETVPWTDAQIVSALREHTRTMGNAFFAARINFWADHLERTGRLTSKTFGFALPLLVKACAVCGKTAHYRAGNIGMCRVHRDVKDIHAERKKLRLNAAGGEYASDRRTRDDADLSHHKLHQTKLRRGARSRHA